MANDTAPTTQQRFRIVWALEPLDRDEFKAAISLLRTLCVKTDCEILPVHVVSTAPVTDDEVTRNRSALMQSGLSRLAPLEVLTVDGALMSNAAQAVCDFAVARHADLVVAATHGRSGFARLLDGSVVESMVFRTRVPLMIVNQSYQPGGGLGRIEFATDARRNDMKAFERILRLAVAMDIPITVYNKIGYLAGIRADDFRRDPSLQRQLRDDIERRRISLDSYRLRAHELGVVCDVVVDSSEGLANEALLKRAAAEDVIMAVVSERGPIAAAVDGSTTQALLRHARCPVWVVRAQG